ncbi:NCS2 family permease [Gallaecimonas mangrovi]|uniref:NCS2 family permease n=1 Tax=Gallaecimonas mangrovi TaxID=2291597 RepID=UPI000E2054F3|nr:NCS2 family permease [Gallaecimonas mangrovi]
MLEKLFKLRELGTNIRREVIAGITTFLTMAYIIVVNPSVLEKTGMDHGAVFVATCLAAAFGCFVMGFLANYPIALAPGMGLNAFFTYTVVQQNGYSWETALGCVFFSGCIFVLLSLFRIREWIINSIPGALKVGIAAGIGLFLALIGLINAHIVVGQHETLVTLGDLSQPSVILAIVGFFLIVALEAHRVRGGVLIAILLITALGIITGQVQYHGVVSAPPSIMPTLAKMDISGAFHLSMLSVIFAFLFVDLFDTSGTLLAVAQKADLLDKKGNLPRLSKALLADSTATIVGATLGTSTTTSYVESSAGVAAGGRSGLTAVTVGVLFLLSLFFAPLAKMVPSFATAGALVYVAVLMMGSLRHLQWDDLTETVPAAVVLVMMPLTYSIATGIALGFISYAVVKALAGRFKEISPTVLVLAILFFCKFAFGG